MDCHQDDDPHHIVNAPELASRFSVSGPFRDLSLGDALRIKSSLDLLRAEYRGPIAEAIVACATGGCRDEGWGFDLNGVRAPDVLTSGGVTVEVKASGDTNHRGRPQVAKFTAPKQRMTRVVVFAHLAGHNVMDLHQWSFHVVPAEALRPAQSVTLAVARQLAGRAVPIAELAAAIQMAAEAEAPAPHGSDGSGSKPCAGP